MQKLLCLTCIFLCTLQSKGQDWVRIYGMDLDAVGRYVIEDYDKGFLFLSDLNYKYSWVFKTDVNGNIIRNKRIGKGTYTVWSSSIEKTMDGGNIICGTWTKFNSSFDAFIIKLNSCAEIEWCKTLITPTNYDMGLKVKQTPEGDYLLLGGYFLTNPTSNVSLFKFNSSGDLIWHQFYPLDSLYNDDQPYDLLIDNDGYLISSSRYYPDPGTTGPAAARHYFIKTDTAGNKIWDLVYGANDYYYGWPWAVKKSNSGSYYEAGNHFFADGTGNPSFVKVLHNGNPSYNRDVNTGMTWGGLASIDFLQDSLLVMIGRWYTDLNTPHDGFFKTDTLGNCRKIKEIFLLTNGYETAAYCKDNKFIAVGNDATGGSWNIYAVKVNSDLEYDSIYTRPFTYDSLCPHPIVSDTVDPDCDNVYVGIEEPFKNPETTRLKVYPNPASDHITIETPKYLVVTNTSSNIPATTVYHQWKSTHLEVYDLSGKKIMEKEVKQSEKEIILDVSGWQRGMYVFRLLFNNQQVGDQKVVVE